jgi:hypothetical protein
MGVLTDFVLANVDDGEAVARSLRPVARWGGLELKGVTSTDLCSVHALLRGDDPNRPVTPRRTFTNPFTKAEHDVTVSMELHDVYEMIAVDDEVVVQRVPDDLLRLLAAKTDADLSTVASAWAASYEDYGPSAADVTAILVELAALARRALAVPILLLRSCPQNASRAGLGRRFGCAKRRRPWNRIDSRAIRGDPNGN